MSTREEQATTAANHRLKHCAIELRRCLACDEWMRSTGAYHRICNTCKQENIHLFRGARIFRRYRTL